ncbi:hypothetical protein [Williamsia sp. CHRR-6]|uniref:hypothetical protein n=1 Tax=Williamsia sp. CHRR-6 TaxID=2835871 RepID=UPI001BDA3F10|nr:hypothetical protein [Williamsia sp. CHRR-6]MBT0566048.1 hypothetical protein [Williamsia sp. CHRR-6]
MTVDGRETAVLQCDHCGVEADHVLQYAGRLLASTECSNCGFTWHRGEADLREEYVKDLLSRVWTKPARWQRRLRRRPVSTLLELPAAIATQPLKFVREFVAVLRR